MNTGGGCGLVVLQLEAVALVKGVVVGGGGRLFV